MVIYSLTQIDILTSGDERVVSRLRGLREFHGRLQFLQTQKLCLWSTQHMCTASTESLRFCNSDLTPVCTDKTFAFFGFLLLRLVRPEQFANVGICSTLRHQMLVPLPGPS